MQLTGVLAVFICSEQHRQNPSMTPKLPQLVTSSQATLSNGLDIQKARQAYFQNES